MTRLACLVEEEATLTSRGVPRRSWVYIAYNDNDDGLGAWMLDRDWIINDMLSHPNCLAYTVVDGRTKANITRYVQRSWDGHGIHRTDYAPWTRDDSDKEYAQWFHMQDMD